MNQLVLVYTMGKVASTAITESLLTAGVICHDVHVLNKSTILTQLEQSVSRGELPKNHIGRSIDIWRRFQRLENISIITLVRDNLSYNLSNLFQNLERKDYKLAEITDKIHAFNPQAAPDWFDHEFKKTTGVDLLKHQFDTHDNYSVITEGRFKILVIKYNLDNEYKEKAISRFIGQPVVLGLHNDSGSKWYGQLYRRFYEKGFLNKEYVQACMSSEYMTHFYSPSEIIKLKNQYEQFYRC